MRCFLNGVTGAVIGGLALLLAACTGADPTPIPTRGVTDLDQVTPSAVDAVAAVPDVVWNRDPSQIVFQADVVGGALDEIEARNHVPLCTVYGDNRVVWVNPAGPDDTDILIDQISDDQMMTFVRSLIINERLYDYGDQPEPAVTRAVEPVVETIVLDVNNDPHKTDAFDGWERDLFTRILDRCRSISSTPVLFEPTAAWVTALQVEEDLTAPVVLWNPVDTGIDLAAIAASGEPRWVDAPIIPALWRTLADAPASVQFVEGDFSYRLALEVPNITASSPPVPTPTESSG